MNPNPADGDLLLFSWFKKKTWKLEKIEKKHCPYFLLFLFSTSLLHTSPSRSIILSQPSSCGWKKSPNSIRFLKHATFWLLRSLARGFNISITKVSSAQPVPILVVKPWWPFCFAAQFSTKRSMISDGTVGIDIVDGLVNIAYCSPINVRNRLDINLISTWYETISR